MKDRLTYLLVSLLTDNYACIIRDEQANLTAVVDPSEAGPVLRILREKGWALNCIFTTHHHPDHTGGNRELKAETGCRIYGYAGDTHRIPCIDVKLQDGEHFTFGDETIEVLYIPGHTLGHIAYHFTQSRWVFCGDTLFSLGCGRLFEGSPEQMFASLKRLGSLPGETLMFCGHEYTEANGDFAITVEPENRELMERIGQVRALRRDGLPTIPSTIASEMACNPFIRAENSRIFADLRARKDRF